MKRGAGFQGGFAEFQRQAMRLHRKMEAVHEELKARSFEAGAGGGKVTAVVSGGKELLAVKIDPEVVRPDDIAMLQDLVVAAVNAALKKADETIEEETNKATGGLKIPGMT